MLINWDEMTVSERVAEIREGFEGFDNALQMELAFAIVLNEFDLDIKEIIRNRHKLIVLNGDPIDYIDDTAGELVIEDE